MNTDVSAQKSELSFTKGQASGNDFVLLNDPDGLLDLSAELVARLCNRRTGIGADGVIRAIRSEKLPEGRLCLQEEPSAEWFMDYRNADGSIAEMCGNGVRVYLQYLIAEGLVVIEPGTSVSIATRAGIVDVAKSALSVQADLGRWRREKETLMVDVPGLSEPHEATFLNLGNPHAVVLLDSEAELDALDLRNLPQLTPAPESGANVEFVVLLEPSAKDGVGRIRMRVYERGVGETLSCGTGIAAAALGSRMSLGRGAPNQWQVQIPGGVQAVRMFPTEEGEHVSISGPAELTFVGEFPL
ncbi:MAG: diaminopimelate epimerase [Microbacteriaceae bacterium]